LSLAPACGQWYALKSRQITPLPLAHDNILPPFPTRPPSIFLPNSRVSLDWCEIVMSLFPVITLDVASLPDVAVTGRSGPSMTTGRRPNDLPQKGNWSGDEMVDSKTKCQWTGLSRPPGPEESSRPSLALPWQIPLHSHCIFAPDCHCNPLAMIPFH
jgi:hypothetical protein